MRFMIAALETALEDIPRERDEADWSCESDFFRLLDLGVTHLQGSPDLQ
jgi:hypothetical protein